MKKFIMHLFAYCILGWSPANALDIGREVGRCFSGGCDVVWGLNRRVDDGVRSKAEALVGPARQAFEEAMNKLFDEKITPMITQIDQAANARLDQVNQIVMEAESGIIEIVDRAGETATNTISTSVDKIRREIIDASFRQADSLSDKIFMRLAEMVDDVDCKIAGQRDAVFEWARSQGEWFPNPFDPCRRKYGFVFSVPKSDDYVSIYRIRQCNIEMNLDSSANVSQILDNYWRLSILARRFRCITQEVAGNKLISRDAAQYSKNFEMWLLAVKEKDR